MTVHNNVVALFEKRPPLVHGDYRDRLNACLDEALVTDFRDVADPAPQYVTVMKISLKNDTPSQVKTLWTYHRREIPRALGPDEKQSFWLAFNAISMIEATVKGPDSPKSLRVFLHPRKPHEVSSKVKLRVSQLPSEFGWEPPSSSVDPFTPPPYCRWSSDPRQLPQHQDGFCAAYRRKLFEAQDFLTPRESLRTSTPQNFWTTRGVWILNKTTYRTRFSSPLYRKGKVILAPGEGFLSSFASNAAPLLDVPTQLEIKKRRYSFKITIPGDQEIPLSSTPPYYPFGDRSRSKRALFSYLSFSPSMTPEGGSILSLEIEMSRAPRSSAGLQSSGDEYWVF